MALNKKLIGHACQRCFVCNETDVLFNPNGLLNSIETKVSICWRCNNLSETQRIVVKWLGQASLTGDELLLEALLRRGYLVYRDENGLWLGTGSHRLDLEVLSLVEGLKVEPVFGHAYRMARVKERSTCLRTMDIALRIASLPVVTGYCIGGCSTDWNKFRKMLWGAKLPAAGHDALYEAPHSLDRTRYLFDCLHFGTTDMGLTLLVKALPLARVFTAASCDGHGTSPAWIHFGYEWSRYWAKAVFDILQISTPNSKWVWDETRLSIEPNEQYGDAEILNFLNDIQNFARRLMNQSAIDKIGRARARTLEAFAECPPSTQRFAEEARRQLAEEFALA